MVKKRELTQDDIVESGSVAVVRWAEDATLIVDRTTTSDGAVGYCIGNLDFHEGLIAEPACLTAGELLLLAEQLRAEALEQLQLEREELYKKTRRDFDQDGSSHIPSGSNHNIN